MKVDGLLFCDLAGSRSFRSPNNGRSPLRAAMSISPRRRTAASIARKMLISGVCALRTVWHGLPGLPIVHCGGPVPPL